MIFSIIFFLLSTFFGLAILELCKINFQIILKLILGLVAGLVTNILLIFCLSLVISLSRFSVCPVIIFTSIISGLFFIRTRPRQIPSIQVKSNLLYILFLLIPIFFVVLIFCLSIIIDSEKIIAGNRLVWVDWPVHLSIISSFFYGNNFPPQNPMYAGKLISYPFFSDFFSAILLVLGANLKTSLILPGIILGSSIIGLLFYLGTIITSKKQTALIGLFIAIFWGGLGFVYYIQDLLGSGNFIDFIKFPFHEYTFYQEKNLWFFSFLYSELLPQRSFLFGIPVFLSALILIITGAQQKKKNYLLLAGFLVGLMPLFHTHAYLSLLMILVLFIPLNIWQIKCSEGLKKSAEMLYIYFLYLLLPIFCFGLIQLPLYLSLDLNQTIAFNFGWMKGTENFIVFWFKNTGLFWPLIILSLIKSNFSKVSKNIIIASLILFILPNFFKFASWPYDNIKIFTFWYFICSFIVADFIYKLYKKNLLLKIIAVLLFISLTFSGFIEVVRIFNIQKTQIPLWSQDDIRLSKIIIEKTEPKSIILTAAVHDHPVTALAGRKIIIGFPGNAWSWGLKDWSQREKDVHDIFKANPNSVQNLLNQYKVNYVLISDREKYFEPQINTNYFNNNMDVVAAQDKFILYKVK